MIFNAFEGFPFSRVCLNLVDLLKFDSFGGRGENLNSISKQYGLSVNSILEENRSIVNVDLIFQGQQLKIPSSSAEEIRAVSKFTGSLCTCLVCTLDMVCWLFAGFLLKCL